MKRLPIGIQSFVKIRDVKENYYYIDKTKVLYELIQSGSVYFLSRPRRFGKSLLVDTIKEAFLGNRDLFRDLYIEKFWDWSIRYPVIKIDFSGGLSLNIESLKIKIQEYLDEIVRKEDLDIKNISISGKFREIIQSLNLKYSRKVVVLIDEYDKPILDCITNIELAKEIRDCLRDLYSVLKASDEYLQFVLLTGVSKFSKVNLFSGLNHLRDITLHEKYSTICGYTESELTIFQERLEGVDREKLKFHYNGYNFLGEKVYNPYDILLFLDEKKYKNYWCETGNPSFLFSLLQEKKYPIQSLYRTTISELQHSSFDIDSITLENLLFQTGYLTIDSVLNYPGEIIYNLTFPNYEVKNCLNSTILDYLSNHSGDQGNNKEKLYKILIELDFLSMKSVFTSFFASIPHDWYRKNQLLNYEAYYASIFYCYFASLGLDVRPEESTNLGQIDMVVIIARKVFVFEFKVIELTGNGSALAQIKERKYFEKYLNESNEVYLVGVEFSRNNRNIENIEFEKLGDVKI